MLSDLLCVCPCHSASTFAHVHVVLCCCPHRHVVVEDCPECDSLRDADNDTPAEGEARHYDGLML
jgi:hypothetical protein